MHKREPSYTVGGNINLCSHCGEPYRGFSKKLKIELPYDPAIPVLGIYPDKIIIQNGTWGISVVAQWLRIRLPMQGTRVRSLVWEDPTCCGTTKSMRHDYWACTLEPVSHNYWAHATEPMCHNYWSPCA